MEAMEWNRVCCPVDFSDASERALRVAVDLCHRLGAELVILHADAAMKIAAEPTRSAPVSRQLEAWREAAERLGARRVAVAHTGGPPEVAIVEFAASEGVDLVVMGTHGRVDREHMLTGSVTEGVVRNAPCPVLTVHPTWRAASE